MDSGSGQSASGFSSWLTGNARATGGTGQRTSGLGSNNKGLRDLQKPLLRRFAANKAGCGETSPEAAGQPFAEEMMRLVGPLDHPAGPGMETPLFRKSLRKMFLSKEVEPP